MAEWWKTISDKLGKAEPAEAKPLTFRERMELEQDRQRKQDKKLGVKKGGPPLAPGESLDAASVQDRRVLASMLGWKLDIKVDAKDVKSNPALIEGYWLGVKRYWKFSRTEDEEDQLSWKLHYFRACNHCKKLVPTIELGDYLEVDAAAKKMMEGQDATIGKSTGRLASYLNDVEQGRPDPHCPRVCPHCRKLIKGGTL